MIIEKNINDIKKDGDFSSKKAIINQDKLAKLQFLLTKGLYSDPVSAVIVEWTNNAVDAVVSLGKNPIENPVIVKVEKDLFSVEDKGIGLSKEEFIDVCMSYLTSTKEESDDYIGCFGIGMKAFMSLDKSASFTCRKNGLESRYIAYQGAEFMEYDLIYEKDTTEENGVKCEINIDWREYDSFVSKAKQKLAYYDTVLLYIGDSLVNNNIIRSNSWQYSQLNNTSEMHFCLKDVYYKIDWEKLGINPIYVPIALRCQLNEGLQPTPSREGIIWNEIATNLIKVKIKETADWFINKYNENWKESENIVTNWYNIEETNKYVTIGSHNIKINNLYPYSSIVPKEIAFKEIKLNTPHYYKQRKYLNNYTCIAKYHYKGRTTKKINYIQPHSSILDNSPVYLVNKLPSGNLRTYIEENYSFSSDSIIVTKFRDRKLGKTTESYLNRSELDYIYNLNLTIYPRDTWRDRIKEFQVLEQQFISKMIDLTNIDTSTDYLKWLEEKKIQQKEDKVKGIYTGNYKILNKQIGEVTISYSRDSSRGNSTVFEKQTYSIQSLRKLSYLTIYFNDTEKEKAIELQRLIKDRKYKVALVGKQEQKKIQDIHNFINYKQFMEHKLLKRMATVWLFKEQIERFEKIYYNDSIKIIKDLIEPFKKDLQILESYINESSINSVNSNLRTELEDLAKQHNLYDFIHWDSYLKVKENMDKYTFLSYLEYPDYPNEENTRVIKSIINQLLFVQQKYKGLHQELEITVKESIKPQELVENEI